MKRSALGYRRLRIAAAASLSVFVVSCGQPSEPAPVDASSLETQSYSGPTEDPAEETKSLTGRQAKIQAIIAEQTSDAWRTSGRRCGTDESARADSPSRAAADCSYNSTTIRPEYNPANGAEYDIPVVFHIIQKTNGEGALDDSFIHSQIDVLNEDFLAIAGSPGAPGVGGKIKFHLATRDPNGNPTSGINRVTNNQYFADPGSGLSPMKNALAWDTTKYFNIYTNDANGALGYATFPSQTAGDREDGVVLLHTSVGRNAPQGGIYDQGRTATHEVGHYLGLFHTFQGGCGTGYSAGDLLSDTPPQSQPQFDCPTGSAANSCGGTADVHNYMNYTQDTCMFRFTTEQINRMRCSIASYRADLVAGTPGSTSGGSSGGSTASTTGSTAGNTTGSTTGSTAGNTTGSTTGSTAGNTTGGSSSGSSGGSTSGTTGSTSGTTGSTTGAGFALTNGREEANLSGAVDSETLYYIDVPEGSKDLSIATFNGTGDVDLYVRYGAAPTLSTFDFRPYLDGNVETVTIPTIKAGRYYVLLHGYDSYAGLSLKAAFTAGQTPGGGVITKTGSLAGKKWINFDVTSTGKQLDFTLTWDNSQDLDMYLYDSAGKVVASGLSTAKPELLKYNPNGKTGAYFIRVYNYSSGSAVSNFKLEIKSAQ
jgi:hypothetical protein